MSVYVRTLSKLYRGFTSVERSVMRGSTEVLMGISGCREPLKVGAAGCIVDIEVH